MAYWTRPSNNLRLPPGMEVTIQPSINMGEREWIVQATLDTVDVYRPNDGPTKIVSQCIFAEDCPEDLFNAQVHQLCRNLWNHEFDEWFQVDGKHVVDPHPTIQNKGEIQL